MPRRTFLRGLGVTMALPFLDAMAPALTAVARAAGRPATRLGFFYTANGVTMEDWNVEPVGAALNLEGSAILRSLAPYQQQVVKFSGLTNPAAFQSGSGGGPHTRCCAGWLNGVPPVRMGRELQSGVTIDQHAAKALGAATPLPSLELSLEPSFIVGNCDNDYPCVYMNTFSWRTPTSPMPMENNPRVVFDRLFGDGTSPSRRVLQMRQDRSILDSIKGEMAGLQRALGSSDRRTVDQYFDSIREVESRIQKAEKYAEVAPTPELDRPTAIPQDDHDYYTLMFDLAYLAYWADVTRVIAFQVSRETSARSYPQAGVTSGHHDMSHHQNIPEKMALNSKINAYHVSLFARLVDQMHKAPDGDGTLLDHSMLLYGSGMSDGNQHMAYNLPTILVGGGSGQVKGNRILKAEVPLMNVGLSMLDKVDVNLDVVGNSTGRVSDL
jgi:hypothetical protein